MTDTVFTPKSFYNIPPIAKVVSVASNTIVVEGIWRSRTASAFDRRGTVLCSNGLFVVDDIVHVQDGQSVLVTSTPVYGPNKPTYAIFNGVSGNSLFPAQVDSLTVLPDEVQAVLAPTFSIPESSLYNQYTSGNGVLPPVEDIFPNAEGVLQGGQEQGNTEKTLNT